MGLRLAALSCRRSSAIKTIRDMSNFTQTNPNNSCNRVNVSAYLRHASPSREREENGKNTPVALGDCPPWTSRLVMKR